ncbi:hypothetical protein SAMN05444392_102459 [Seinonella peptonophila]|uniref:Serine/threonine protein kinase n=1 Tax=Seinonella peptonophila TaxID=112248 RepID=A0A1M4VPG0_9BACL|nr:hypothetical protein [Seinonella peptonophila]SHE70730.1 hypothetical protein SAMN05444392_102459 [Seinonella peptonophila]
MNIDTIEDLIGKVKIAPHPDNQSVIIHSIPDDFTLIGIGTDAVVVQHESQPTRVFKVYTENRIYKIENEYKVYQRLQPSPFFAQAFFRGDDYLCLSYEQGPTLYECLERGIIIPKQIVLEVEQARHYARTQGLNPRDIHLKNVLLQNGHAKVIDVSEYLMPGDDLRWSHLVQGYELFYDLIKGRKIPSWMMEWVKKAYYHQLDENFSVLEFVKRMQQMITFK